MTDRDRVHCAIFLLRNEARHWWEGIKEGTNLETLPWTDFKVQFFEKYFSKDVRAHKLKEFLELRQGDLPMIEYIRRFERGCLYAPFIARDAEEKKNHFIRGLQPEIRRDIRMSDASTFRQLVDKALMAAQDEQDIQNSRRPQGVTQRPWKKNNFGNRPFRGKGTQPIRQPTGPPPPSPRPTCPKCGKSHSGECVHGTRSCFRCHQPGHMVKECPKPPPNVPGRVFAMTQEQIDQDPSMIAGTIFILEEPIYALIDSGSTHSFISKDIIAHLNLEPNRLNYEYRILIPSGEEMCSNLVIINCPIRVHTQTMNFNLILLPIQNFKVILGMDWLTKFKAQIDCASKTPKFPTFELSKNFPTYFPMTFPDFHPIEKSSSKSI
ncbi:PREDICTED: uncharacterized protein LOC105965752 [Erythranthe guttata]|uniref:uncharacterized protein LOC105965752 n=1 Tax=Erythranthe guttata TaxID=4155 RepID=UPI00064DF165|nr:PREDICTED: uncharacterized protein LOC105965752 [Erythranthe guttata]|eukprot:XP_012845769.1 PREDICTED: uncharacterized protein LOC105965752 [Erythranthe guttata]